MKRKLIIVLYVCMPFCMMAQDDMMSKINAVKMDSTYLYGEATLKTLVEASSSAKQNLLLSIMEWIEKDSDNTFRLILAPLIQNADSMITKRAEMIRFFTYVPKDYIKAKLLREGIKAANTSPKPDTININTDGSQTQATVLKQMIGIKSFFQLKDVIEPLAAKGIISSYGKYATMTQPSESYLIVYDPQGDIRAFLGKGTSSRKNLITGIDDSEHNYSGCGAIWFQLNK